MSDLFTPDPALAESPDYTEISSLLLQCVEKWIKDNWYQRLPADNETLLENFYNDWLDDNQRHTYDALAEEVGEEKLCANLIPLIDEVQDTYNITKIMAEHMLTELAGGAPCKVTGHIQDEENEADLLIFECGDGEVTSAAYVYDDGTLFHLKDWQGGYPGTLDKIGEYDWIDVHGHDAIVLNDRPRSMITY